MKRVLSHASVSAAKRQHQTPPQFAPNKIATRDAAAAADDDPPLGKLLTAMGRLEEPKKKSDTVVYWMRMGDLRITDNRALSLASKHAQKESVPLVVLFILSPQDWVAHDRSPRRIDFMLRNLKLIKDSLSGLHIPLYTTSVDVRRRVPSVVTSFLEEINCHKLFANIEYEVDELRRDIQICTLAKEKNIKAEFVHDKCIVDPGVVVTKHETAYAVYSPYQKRWLEILNQNQKYYLEDCPKPQPNPESIRESDKFAHMFSNLIPDLIPGFELQNEDKELMSKVWPAGEEHAEAILSRFLHTKANSSQLGAVSPVSSNAEESSKQSRVAKYNDDRNRGDLDTTSRLSPYLSAGILSARRCVRATMKLRKGNQVDGTSASGIGRWVQELAWRDFYINILVSSPRVSMGRPYQEKFATVVWEPHVNPSDPSADGEMLKKWKQGQTGYPIVDAAMRCLNQMGWVHNRMRMISAMFLTKDLMMDWHVGEKYFMEQLIDGDLGSNNGGWQWCASNGVDPCPYFRIFNPSSQSLKADPAGDFIRHWVPELKKLKGKDIHEPSAETARALGYPLPIVKHSEARAIAMRRYKNPGEK